METCLPLYPEDGGSLLLNVDNVAPDNIITAVTTANVEECRLLDCYAI
jgi:hypothetical protein